MEPLTYSSTAAFLAHFRALTEAAMNTAATGPLTAQERELLETMNRLMEGLTPDERDALLAEAVTVDTKLSEERRRRERALLRLRRLLANNRMISA
jgi:hypothetical protein